MAVATKISDGGPRGFFHGSYAGTTAAQNIHIGFKPSYIRAINVTDKDIEWIWSKNDLTTIMKIAGTPASESCVITQVDNGTVIGFALPTNAVANEDAKTYEFWAWHD